MYTRPGLWELFGTVACWLGRTAHAAALTSRHLIGLEEPPAFEQSGCEVLGLEILALGFLTTYYLAIWKGPPPTLYIYRLGHTKLNSVHQPPGACRPCTREPPGACTTIFSLACLGRWCARVGRWAMLQRNLVQVASTPAASSNRAVNCSKLPPSVDFSILSASSIQLSISICIAIMNYRPVAIEDFDPSSWYGEGLPDMRWNQCHDDLIEDMWEQAFNSKPYTTLCMINYLLRAAKISCVDYLRQPDILQRRLQEHGIESLLGDHNDLEDLIALPGRCTSFALHVAQLVESLAPRSPGKARPFNFLFYDFDNHRLAWCPTSKRLIDSSSLLGTPRMEEDEWLDNPDATRSWKAKGEGALSKMQESGKPVRLLIPCPCLFRLGSDY